MYIRKKIMRSLTIASAEAVQESIRDYFKKNEEARFIHRLHAILLKIDKKEHTCESLGKLLGHSNRTISNWINKLNETSDIEALRDKPKPGRPPRLTDSQLLEIKAALQEKPEDSGIPANIWDGKSLSFYISKTYSVEIGVRQSQRLFKKLGFGLKRARPVVAKGDPVKKEMAKKTSGETTKR